MMLTGNIARLRQGGHRDAIGYALITGLFIAAYTLWDKQAVSHFAIMPMVLDWGANVGRAILLTPFALRYSEEAVIEWREHKWEAIVDRHSDPALVYSGVDRHELYAGELRRAGARDRHPHRHADGRALARRRRCAAAACGSERDGVGDCRAGARLGSFKPFK